MSRLLVKPQRIEVTSGITIVHEVTRTNSPLNYVGLKIVDLVPGATYSENTKKQEYCIVALTGKINVFTNDESYLNLGTRESVFARKPTDSVYVSGGQGFQVEAVSPARVVLCNAPSRKQLPNRLIKASDNRIEHRGKYNNKRLVHNILADSDSLADSLLVVEVFTEGGNWSSYPPHKHDQDNLPNESFLEEAYYHEMDPDQGFVLQRVYTDDRTLDETMTVKNGDVVIVPKGYHPVGVPDGYTSYYLNVMAGSTRIWKFYNDPDHEWILDRE